MKSLADFLYYTMVIESKIISLPRINYYISTINTIIFQHIGKIKISVKVKRWGHDDVTVVFLRLQQFSRWIYEGLNYAVISTETEMSPICLLFLSVRTLLLTARQILGVFLPCKTWALGRSFLHKAKAFHMTSNKLLNLFWWYYNFSINSFYRRI